MKPIFIFSLPRSGSTLAQRIIASHSQISTLSEPWFLLPIMYTMRREGIYTDYNHADAVIAVNDFIHALPNGEKDYLDEIRQFSERLYERSATGEEAYFLDKTPRYHLIVEEIFRVFPDAKYIFLWRNPLSIVASLLQSFLGDKWILHRSKIDLYTGLSNLIDAYEKYSDLAISLRYEDLIASPELECERIFSYLELPNENEILNDLSNGPLLAGQMGDRLGSTQYNTINQEPLEKWKSAMRNPVRKAWCRKYIQWIGKDRLTIMGYEQDKLLKELKATPTSIWGAPTDAMWMAYSAMVCVTQPRLIVDNLKKHKLWTSMTPLN